MSEKRLGGILVNLKDYLYKRLISNMISLKKFDIIHLKIIY